MLAYILNAIQIFQTVLHAFENSLKSGQLFMLITVHFCLIIFSDFVHNQSEIKAKPTSEMISLLQSSLDRAFCL